MRPNGMSVLRLLSIASLLWLVSADRCFAQITISGDYNGNGEVEANDYLVWKATFNEYFGLLWADGNSDGIVNAADYTIWCDHLGTTLAGSASRVTQVPEPTAALLVIALMSVTAVRHRLRSSRG